MLYAGDLTWWQTYAEHVKRRQWPEFRGERWTISGSAKSRYGVQHVRGIPHARGLSREPGTINLGGNSGHATVGLVHQFGAARIVLLGYDMQRTGGKSHWHGDHPRGMGNGSVYPRWAQRFVQLARDLEAVGVVVVNATRQTALTCFPRVPLELALNGEVTA